MDQLAQRLEARFDPTAFPASDLRLGAAGALTKLFLSEACSKPRLAEEISANHFCYEENIIYVL